MIYERKEKLPIPRVLNIGFDLDGVIANIFPPLRRRFLAYGVDINLLMQQKLQTGAPVPFDLRDWPEIKTAGLIEVLNQLFSQEDLYLEAEPIKPVVDLADQWHKEGQSIFFISSRSQALAQVTQRWLKEVAGLDWLEEGQLFLNPQHPQYDLGTGFKPGLARQLRLHVFFEDYLESLQAIDHPEMYLKVLLRYPYNRQAELSSEIMSLGSVSLDPGGINLSLEEIQGVKDLVRKTDVAQC